MHEARNIHVGAGDDGRDSDGDCGVAVEEDADLEEDDEKQRDDDRWDDSGLVRHGRRCLTLSILLVILSISVGQGRWICVGY
jgi:hypothetical protein